MRAAMRGIRRTLGTSPDRKTPATAGLVMEMLKRCPPTLAGKRDRALLALGFAGAFRRSELVALTVADLVEALDGYRVVIRKSKGDQEVQGQEIAIAARLPATAGGGGADMADSGREQYGPGVPPGAEGREGAADGVAGSPGAAIVKVYAERAGLDPADFGGHSLRSGFLTSAAEAAGASVFKMLEVSRHNSYGHAARLRADLFREHAAGAAVL